MKRDLRLLHDRSSVSRSNYIEEVVQPTATDDLATDEMRFDNCLAQVDGELYYVNVKAKAEYEDYLNAAKESSQGNLWKYLRDVQHLYEGSHLSQQARTWNLELLNKSQSAWFSWVEQIQYPGIQGYCLFYSPSLDCLVDFMTYLVEKNLSRESGKINEEHQQILVMLLINSFIEHMVTIEGNMASDNRTRRSPEWNIDKWKNEESTAYMQEFVRAFLNFPQELTEPILCDILSDEWIFQTRILHDQYRKKFWDTFIELFAEHYKKDLAAIIQSSSWESSKSALYHRLMLYRYWAESSGEVSSETGKNLRDTLWQEWKKIIRSDTHITHTIYSSEDGFQLVWLSGKLMSDEKDMTRCLDELLSGMNTRFDGWNSSYEKSRHVSNVVFCILTVAAMAAEWKIHQQDERDAAENFYWHVFEKANKFARGNRYLDEVAQSSLLQIWSRMTILASQNPFLSRKDFIWENILNIDSYEYRVYIVDTLICNIRQKNLDWAWDEQLKRKILSIMTEEKVVLEKEKSANPLYYDKFYRREGAALDRCLNFLNADSK